jgi:hypothetical protein
MPQDSQQRREAAIDANYVGLHLIAVPDRSDVAEVHGVAIHRLDRHVVHRRYQFRAAVEPNQVLARPDLHSAGGKNEILKI